MKYTIAEEVINELKAANYENSMKVLKRSHERATELSKKKNPEEWTQKDMDKSIQPFKHQEHIEKKFGVTVESMSLKDKADYIKETIATMMDVQPIMPVGQEHPAKKEKRWKENQEKERS